MIKTITLNNISYTVDDSADIPPWRWYIFPGGDMGQSISRNDSNINFPRKDGTWERFLILSCDNAEEANRLGVPVTAEQRTYSEADLREAYKAGMIHIMKPFPVFLEELNNQVFSKSTK